MCIQITVLYCKFKKYVKRINAVTWIFVAELQKRKELKKNIKINTKKQQQQKKEQKQMKKEKNR